MSNLQHRVSANSNTTLENEARKQISTPGRGRPAFAAVGTGSKIGDSKGNVKGPTPHIWKVRALSVCCRISEPPELGFQARAYAKRYSLSMTSSQRTTVLLCSLLLVLFQVPAYAPALNGAFLHYDDNTYVYGNAMVKALNAETVSAMFSHPYFRSYAPLVLLSHAVDYALWNGNPWGHHLTSLLLHSANVVLVFLLGAVILSPRRLSAAGVPAQPLFSLINENAIAGAFVAAALYSLHPMRVESVAWVSDRKDLLLALFLLSSVLAYLQYDHQRGTPAGVKWFVASLGCTVLALLSKSIATMTPLLLLSLDGLLLHRRASGAEWRRLLFEKSPYFLLSAGFGLLAVWAAPGEGLNDVVAKMTTMQKMLMPFYSLMFYPAMQLVPVALTPVYTSPSVGWMAAGALTALLAIGASVWRARHGHFGWLLATAGYVLPLLPTIFASSAGIQPWADRYAYVPSIALFLLVGGGFSIIWERSSIRIRWASMTAVLAVGIVFVYLDRHQTAIWKDSEALWRAVVRGAPEVANGYDNLGIALADKGDSAGALAMYREAIRLQANFADPYYNAAVLFQAKEMKDSAVTFYRLAIAADTAYVDAYINLANILANDGNRESAITLYERALALNDDNADAYYNLGCVRYLNGDPARALECFKRVVILSPGYSSAYNNMGVIFLEQKNVGAALESFVRAARLGSSEAQQRLAKAGYSWK